MYSGVWYVCKSQRIRCVFKIQLFKRAPDSLMHPLGGAGLPDLHFSFAGVQIAFSSRAVTSHRLPPRVPVYSLPSSDLHTSFSYAAADQTGSTASIPRAVSPSAVSICLAQT